MYGIIHDSIFSSSLLDGKPPDKIHTAYVFMCMNILADAGDNVEHSRDVLAAMFRVTRATLDEAIAELEAPDPSSRTQAEDGRRIVRLAENRDWGWHIINRDHYKRLRNAEDRREYQQVKYQERKDKGHNDSTAVNNRQHPSTVSTYAVGSRQEAVGIRQETKNLSASAMRVGRGVKRKALENGEQLPEGEITADQAFDEIFWPEYPRRRDKEDARKAWKSLKLRDDDEDKIKQIMASLRRDVKDEWRDRPPDKIPYPAHWIRKKGWMD